MSAIGSRRRGDPGRAAADAPRRDARSRRRRRRRRPRDRRPTSRPRSAGTPGVAAAGRPLRRPPRAACDRTTSSRRLRPAHRRRRVAHRPGRGPHAADARRGRAGRDARGDGRARGGPARRPGRRPLRRRARRRRRRPDRRRVAVGQALRGRDRRAAAAAGSATRVEQRHGDRGRRARPRHASTGSRPGRPSRPGARRSPASRAARSTARRRARSARGSRSTGRRACRAATSRRRCASTRRRRRARDPDPDRRRDRPGVHGRRAVPADEVADHAHDGRVQPADDDRLVGEREARGQARAHRAPQALQRLGPAARGPARRDARAGAGRAARGRRRTPPSSRRARSTTCPTSGSAARPTATSSTSASASPTSRSIVAVSFATGGDASAARPGSRTRSTPTRACRSSRCTSAMTDVGAIGLVGGAVGRRSARALDRRPVRDAPEPARRRRLRRAVTRARARAWSWLSWLPHVGHAASPLEGEHVAVGEQPARDLAAARRRARGRAPRRTSDGRKRAPPPHDRRRARRRGRRARGASSSTSCSTNCADVDDRRRLARARAAPPARRLRRHRRGLLRARGRERHVDGDRAGRSREASVDGLAPRVAEAIARSLAPVDDTTAGGAAASVPRSVALVELLDLVDPTPARIAERWRARAPTRSTPSSAPAADGPFALDLRADGPHALVAGTTGAGKSELLQTLIAALAASHPPDRIAFLLVDYKGGAAFKDCVRLPHTVGMVTDLDEHQVHRALVSLNAELQRREHVLATPARRTCVELERRDPRGAPPSLVIVIDEFATLAKEVPEFVDGVVDVAQRGRSLGVHLVLATQRPGNAVTENIRANTNLRVALRVAGPAESDDVIGAPDAARLPRSVPGRALARTGPTELQLFQAGYVGGRTSSGESARRSRSATSRPAASRPPARRDAPATRSPTSSCSSRRSAARRPSWGSRRRRAVAARRWRPRSRSTTSSRSGRPAARRSASSTSPSASARCRFADRPRDRRQPAGLRRERLGQDDGAAHDRGRARGDAQPARPAHLRPGLRGARPAGARGAAALRLGHPGRGRGARHAAAQPAAAHDRRALAAVRRPPRREPRGVTSAASRRAAGADRRAAGLLRGLRRDLRARRPRRARRRAAAARRRRPRRRRAPRHHGRPARRRCPRRSPRSSPRASSCGWPTRTSTRCSACDRKTFKGAVLPPGRGFLPDGREVQVATVAGTTDARRSRGARRARRDARERRPRARARRRRRCRSTCRRPSCRPRRGR